MTKIVIEGSKVRYVREVIEKEVSLDDLLGTMGASKPQQISFLPDGCRSVIQRGNNVAFVIERPPGIKNLSWSEEKDYDGDGDVELTNFKLYMPWTYLTILANAKPLYLHGAAILWSKQRVASEKSPMFMLNHPNVYSNNKRPGVYCLGEVYLEDRLPLHRAVNDLVDKIYTGPHNSDLWKFSRDIPQATQDAGFKAGSRSQRGYLSTWEEISNTKTQKQLTDLIMTPSQLNYGEYLQEISLFNLSR